MSKGLFVGLLALAHMTALVDQFATSAVAGQLKSAFSLSETGLGTLQGLAVALPYIAVVLPLGRLADRIPPQRLTAGGFTCAFARSLAGAQLTALALEKGVGPLVGVGLGLTIVGAMSDALFGGAGGLGNSLAALFLAVPFACAAITLSCDRLWRLAEPPESKVRFAGR